MALPARGIATAPLSPSPAQGESTAWARVHVTSSPDGADIYLDGRFVGNTPSDFRLPSGEHSVKITLDGKEWSRAVQVTSGEIGLHAETFTEVAIPSDTSTVGTGTSEALVTILLTSDPTGADIYADDSFMGKAPVTMKLKPGQHNFRAFLKDYNNWFRAVAVEAGKEVHLTAAMVKSN